LARATDGTRRRRDHDLGGDSDKGVAAVDKAQSRPASTASSRAFRGVIAAHFLVEVLAKEIGSRGITVNSILPTAIDGAGVSTDGVRDQVMQFVHSSRSIQRMGTLDDVANAAE
jgi:NAD(P)-dependent dehydrogenase (short-subunit alcohol dehydrogenase family)